MIINLQPTTDPSDGITPDERVPEECSGAVMHSLLEEEARGYGVPMGGVAEDEGGTEGDVVGELGVEESKGVGLFSMMKGEMGLG